MDSDFRRALRSVDAVVSAVDKHVKQATEQGGFPPVSRRTQELRDWLQSVRGSIPESDGFIIVITQIRVQRYTPHSKIEPDEVHLIVYRERQGKTLAKMYVSPLDDLNRFKVVLGFGFRLAIALQEPEDTK